jgi:proteasome component ECM29
MADLTSGRSFEEFRLDTIQDMWRLGFRGLDDIKESVRLAALNTCKSLSNMTLKAMENGAEETTKKMLDVIIPYLLKHGLPSNVEEIKLFSLKTLLSICKSNTKHLKPFVIELLGTFIESFSALEPNVMNYLTFHTDKYETTQEQLDLMRVNMTKSSAVMNGVEYCLECIDNDNSNEFITRLSGIIRRGIGLPTRAGKRAMVV